MLRRIALCSLLLAATHPALAVTLAVAPSGNDQTATRGSGLFRTISAAMRAAIAGDTISVSAGTYGIAAGEQFPITMKSGVQLAGAGYDAPCLGPFRYCGVTIIDATGSNHRVFIANGNTPDTLITRVTITGGLENTVTGSAVLGGAMYATGGDQTVIRNVSFHGNEARGVTGGDAYGGAIYSTGANRIQNCVFYDNTALGGGTGGNAYGGAVVITGNSIIVNSTFARNHAIDGGGGGAGHSGAIDAAAGAQVYNDIIANNDATTAGGLGGTPAEHHNLFFNNAGGDGVSFGAGDVLGFDPFFFDVNEFRVTSASHAIGAGTMTPDVWSTDIDETPRKTPPTIGAYEGIRHLRVDDFDGDGKADLLWRNSATGATAIWFLNGLVPTPQSGSTRLQFADNAFLLIASGDFNGDGKADVLWRNASAGETFMWMMNGLHASSVALRTVTAPWVFDAAYESDVNYATVPISYVPDGKTDIVWRSPMQLYFWQMDGGNIVAEGYWDPFPLGTGWYRAAIGDFNGDGRYEQLFRNDQLGATSIAFKYGPTQQTSLQIGSDWRVVAIGDFNGDGRDDIVWRNQTTGDNIIWLMGGARILDGSGSTLQIADPNWQIVAVGDFDNDGRSDLVWRNQSSGIVTLWLMNGPLIQPGSGTIAQIAPPWTVVAPPKGVGF